MSGGNKLVNAVLVCLEEWLNMLLVEYFGALCLWKDEVEKEKESNPRVKRNPVKKLSVLVLRIAISPRQLVLVARVKSRDKRNTHFPLGHPCIGHSPKDRKP